MILRHVLRIVLILSLLPAVASCSGGKKVTEEDTMNTDELRKLLHIHGVLPCLGLLCLRIDG